MSSLLSTGAEWLFDLGGICTMLLLSITNSQEEGNDVSTCTIQDDPIWVCVGKVPHARAKMFKEAFQALVCAVQDQFGFYKHVKGVGQEWNEFEASNKVGKHMEK